MTETKTYCDHCGKELDPMRDYTELDIKTIYEQFKTDLCSECAEELYCFIKDFISKGNGDNDE